MIAQLPVLIVNAHTRCNCRCVMCDIWKETNAKEFSLEQLRAQMPAMERLGVRWVVFSGGEPLMHSDLFALARTLRAKQIRVTMLSTGLLLERFAAQIAETIDDVIVSLDGPEAIHDAIRRIPGCFRAIERGVAALHAQSPDFRIAARSTVQHANHDSLAQTAAAAREIGLASISYLAADVNTSAFGRDLAWPADRQSEIGLCGNQLATLERQIDALIADPFVIDSPQHLRRIVSHFRAQLGLEPFQAPRCNAPWVSAVIESNGDVRPCFFHPIVGSLQTMDLEESLNSENAQAFRSRLDVASNPTCRSCVCSLFLRPEA